MRRRGGLRGHPGEALGVLLGGLAAGAGLMYLLDPDRGRRRRARIRDQAVRLSHQTADAAAATGRDLAHRSRGLLAEARARLRVEQISDRRLEDRVHTRLGRVTHHAALIRAEASGGRVLLSGPVLGGEAERVVAAARRVRGVREVEDRLERHRAAAGSPALEGAGTLEPPLAP